jgi:DNA mismatch repair protein MutS
MTDLSPMVVQYREIKSRHQDAILFFRLGDFYEMFNEDAEMCSRELKLTLTGRGEGDNRMPMCGIPYHAAENYIAKLLEKGHKVAICEQVEDPKLAKGVVKREVIKTITPGTVLEFSMLSDKSSNYLAAVAYEKGKYGLAYVEASTGEFRVAEIDELEKLYDEINRINPAEIIISDMIAREPAPASRGGSIATTQFKDIYDKPAAEQILKDHFKVASLAAFGLDNFSAGLSAAVAILDYLRDTQKTTLSHISKLQPYRIGQFMFVDSQTRKNLELTQTIRDRSFLGSLLWVLDRCQTNMGSRLLKNWLLAPLLEVGEINRRLEAVTELQANALLRAELSEELKWVYDVERLTGRVATQNANARDLISLAESLKRLPRIEEILKKSKSELIMFSFSLDLNSTVELISQAINDNPPFQLTGGGIVKDGFNVELDELKKAARGGKAWIAELENRERLRTGIKSLKVGFTKVFGYYIEVSNSNLSAVPPDYIRKQTLVNCERFITPELKEKEAFILNAEESLKDLEYKLFCEIRFKVAESTKELQKAAQQLAQIDALLSLAEAAVANNYCRPSFKNALHIKGSRHPVVEKTLGEQNFTPNDVVMDEDSRFLMITGPNMSGKSTFMRQIALICLMAQIGSFVPAKSAELSIIDRIFTRIGAMDDIFSGQSTFMVEMTETANILNNATKDSLIILDEIGRGTATFDGMSIAAAVAEFIHAKLKAKTLFATHYHEITQLAEKHPGMRNLNVAVKEEGDQIIFLHKIVEGPADKSYGIAVAKLAGLPREVIDRARQVYETLDMIEKKTLLS